MEQTKFTRFKRIVNKKLLSILIILTLLFCSLYFTTCKSATNEYKSNTIEYVSPPKNIANIDTFHIIDSVKIKDSIKNELINEVHKHVKKYSKGYHKFIPAYLVHAGLNNNIDICFIMAQTQIETCYGTTGIGRELSRRSMFGVMNMHYSSYENAINHYCKVLKKYYLVKGKTEQHLMTKYVTYTGSRYAKNPNYETELRIAYNHIKRTTNIYSLQQEWNKF